MLDFYFDNLELYVVNLNQQRDFFLALGYYCSNINEGRFVVSIGRSKMTFLQSEKNYLYHYCILIDRSQFDEKKQLLEDLDLKLVSFEDQEVVRNESWDSDSLYFLDPNGNMPEFIVHNTLAEIGEMIAEVPMAVHDTIQTAKLLREAIGITPFKGKTSRFLDVGVAGSMFILIDPVQKPLWFPYDLPATFSPCKGSLIKDGKRHYFSFVDGELELS